MTNFETAPLLSSSHFILFSLLYLHTIGYVNWLCSACDNYLLTCCFFRKKIKFFLGEEEKKTVLIKFHDGRLKTLEKFDNQSDMVSKFNLNLVSKIIKIE
jgi:hypothetical protein